MPWHRNEVTLPPLGREHSALRDAVTRGVEAELKRLGNEQEHRARALKELFEYGRRERARILGPAATKLAAFRQQQRSSRARYGIWSRRQGETCRLEYLRLARELGVDTDELFRLGAYLQGRARLLLAGASPKTRVPLGRKPLDSGRDVTQLVFEPPFLGHLDLGYYQLTGDGELLELQSFLDTSQARSGGGVRIKNWSADNQDIGLAFQENGYLGCYVTGDSDGPIAITATLECVESDVSLHTETEFFSFAAGFIGAEIGVTFGAYVHDVSEIDFQGVALAYRYYEGEGDPDENEYAGPTFLPAPSGALYTEWFLLPTVVPRNTNIGIYVGTRHQVLYSVNDVSVDGRAAGRWNVKEFRVAQL